MTGEGRHRGRNGDDVFPEIPAADAALGAHAAVRTIRHGDALERFLKIRLEPRLRDTRVDVIPRKRRVQSRVGGDASIDASLAAAALPAIPRVAELIHDVPLAVDDGAVLPSHAALLDGAVERAKRLGGSVPPRGAVRAELPRAKQHRRQRTVAAPEEIFHGGDANRGEVGLDALDASKRVAKELALALEFGRRHAVPLKRRVRFRRKVGNGERHGEFVFFPSRGFGHGAHEPTDGFGDAENVGVLFARQPNHKVQFDVSPSSAIGVLYASKQLLVRESFVDDVAQTLRARLGRERQTDFPAAAENVGDGIVESIDALRRKTQRDVFIFEPVFNLQSHRGEREVIRTRQR